MSNTHITMHAGMDDWPLSAENFCWAKVQWFLDSVCAVVLNVACLFIGGFDVIKYGLLLLLNHAISDLLKRFFFRLFTLAKHAISDYLKRVFPLLVTLMKHAVSDLLKRVFLFLDFVVKRAISDHLERVFLVVTRGILSLTGCFHLLSCYYEKFLDDFFDSAVSGQLQTGVIPFTDWEDHEVKVSSVKAASPLPLELDSSVRYRKSIVLALTQSRSSPPTSRHVVPRTGPACVGKLVLWRWPNLSAPEKMPSSPSNTSEQAETSPLPGFFPVDQAPQEPPSLPSAAAPVNNGPSAPSTNITPNLAPAPVPVPVSGTTATPRQLQIITTKRHNGNMLRIMGIRTRNRVSPGIQVKKTALGERVAACGTSQRKQRRQSKRQDFRGGRMASLMGTLSSPPMAPTSFVSPPPPITFEAARRNHSVFDADGDWKMIDTKDVRPKGPLIIDLDTVMIDCDCEGDSGYGSDNDCGMDWILD